MWARSNASITFTPIPKLDPPTPRGPYPTPLARIPRVDETECVGCNLCALVCPVQNCITMEERPTGLPPETWDERVKSNPAADKVVEKNF